MQEQEQLNLPITTYWGGRDDEIGGLATLHNLLAPCLVSDTVSKT